MSVSETNSTVNLSENTILLNIVDLSGLSTSLSTHTHRTVWSLKRSVGKLIGNCPETIQLFVQRQNQPEGQNNLEQDQEEDPLSNLHILDTIQPPISSGDTLLCLIDRRNGSVLADIENFSSNGNKLRSVSSPPFRPNNRGPRQDLQLMLMQRFGQNLRARVPVPLPRQEPAPVGSRLRQAV